MKIVEALDIIRFNTSTQNDLSNKNLNDLYTDRNIIRQFKYALDKYAKYTKAIEDIFSFPLITTTEWVDLPPLALRSQSYSMVYVWLGDTKYLLGDPGLTAQNHTMSYQTVNGIPIWFVPWKDKAYINPSANSTYNTTTLNGAISATATTITLTSASNFLQYNGRITIGSEKITYRYRTSNVLYGCVRGEEQTTAASHLDLATVNENNMWIFYRRLHTEITDDKRTWDNELDIPDEHVEMVTDYTSYKLLSKIDSTRASFYKVNFDEWLKEVKSSIIIGRNNFPKVGKIRSPYQQETGQSNYSL
jgi:hypothetical protein